MSPPCEYGVVVITRDRPAYVGELLSCLARAAREGNGAVCRAVAVVDDSRLDVSRETNAALCRAQGGSLPCVHLTAGEQERLGVQAFGPEDWRLFARPLGDPSWNVGSSRNTGSLYLLQEADPGPDVVVFLDDDVLPQDGHEDWLAAMVGTCHREGVLAGYTLSGLPDESRLFRIRRQALRSLGRGVPDTERWTALPLSGGCVAVPGPWVRRLPYTSLYNEDYFLFLELESHGVGTVALPRPDAVVHRASPDGISLGALQNEAVGDMIHFVLMRASRDRMTLDGLGDREEDWQSVRRTYLEDLAELRGLCAASPAEEDRRHLPTLDALAAWVEALRFDPGPFREYGRARTLWSGRFATS